MEEIWKCLGDIEGFDEYQYFISNKGRVKNGYRGKKIAEMLSISESSVSNVRKLMKRDRIDDSI